MNTKEASTSGAASRRSATGKRARNSLDTSATSPTQLNLNIMNSSRRKIRRLNKPTNQVNSISGKKASISRTLPRSRASQNSPRNLAGTSTGTVSTTLQSTKITPPIDSSASCPNSPNPESPTTAEENSENFAPKLNNSQSSSPLKSPMRAMLRQLQTDLSPKFISPSPPSSTFRCSRYGRTQKMKEPIDFLDTNLALAVRRSISEKTSPPSDTLAPTLPRKSRSVTRAKPSTSKSNDVSPSYNVDLIRSPVNDRSRYLSPIEKLIEINKIAKTQTQSTGNSPNVLGEVYVKTPRNAAATALSPKFTARQIDFDQTVATKPHTLDPDPKRELPIVKLSPAVAKKSVNSPRRQQIPPPPLFSESETPTTPSSSSKSKPDSPLQLILPVKRVIENSMSPFVTMRKIDVASMMNTPLKSPIDSIEQISPLPVATPNTPPLQIHSTSPIKSPDMLKVPDDSSLLVATPDNLSLSELETPITSKISSPLQHSSPKGLVLGIATLPFKVSSEQSPPNKRKLSLCKVSSPESQSDPPSSPDTLHMEMAPSPLKVIPRTDKPSPFKSPLNRMKLSLCKVVSPSSPQTNARSPDRTNVTAETTPTKKNQTLSPYRNTRPGTPQVKRSSPNWVERIIVSLPLDKMRETNSIPSVKSRSNNNNISPGLMVSPNLPKSQLTQNDSSSEIIPTEAESVISSPKTYIISPSRTVRPGTPQIRSTDLCSPNSSTAIGSPIAHELPIIFPKTPTQQSPTDIFKKPTPKSLRKLRSPPRSPMSITPAPESPNPDEPNSSPATELVYKSVDFQTTSLISSPKLKTYKNRRRLLSNVSAISANSDSEDAPQLKAEEVVVPQPQRLEVPETPSEEVILMETTLDCLPATESTGYNLLKALANIKSDPHFGLLSNSPIPDDDIPLQCEVELSTETFDMLSEIKTETDVELPVISEAQIKSEIGEPVAGLNKSFEGDNSPSVSSADSAKGSSIVDDDPSSATADGWQVGNLAWARIGNYPYWPCIVCRSPEGTFLSFSAAKKPQQRVHVRFLADNGRRCWATANCMMSFRSIEDFENLKRQLPANIKAKDPRARAFNVSQANLILWHQAVVEGQMLGTFPTNKRVQVFERLLNEESLPKNQFISLKRNSIASQDSFDSLFTDVDRRITSTPSIVSSRRSSIQEIESIVSDNYQPDAAALSRSPTPESPMYEELSFNKGQSDVNDTSNIQNFLLSLSSTTDPPASPVPDDLHSRLDFDQHLDDMDNDNFRNFYKQTKANFLGESDSCNESHLKHLAHKMWMLKQLKLAKKKSASKRGSAGRSEEISKPVFVQKHQAKKRKVETKSPSLAKKVTVASARRSIRSSITSFRSRKSVDEASSVQPKAEPELDNSEIMAEKAAKKAQRAEEKEKRELLEMSKYFMKQYPKNILFKGLEKELVCRYCHRTGNLVKCQTSTCHEHVHDSCAINPTATLEQSKPNKGRKSIKSLNSSHVSHVTGDDDGTIDEPNQSMVELSIETKHQGPAYCPDCAKDSQPVCYVCKTADGTVLRCTDKNCGRQFHVACLRYWPQNKINHQNDASQQLLCPCHVCHTCISDDPRGKHYHTSNSKLTKCVKCPATYHIDSCCIPAGSQLLTATQLICPRHRVEVRKPVNANWCFICSSGGQLVCCETCPTAFHAECLKVDVSESCYICEECETGRFPLYGEIVWAKIGSCRWWPAVIVPPSEIPDTVMAVKRQPQNFAIRFFGSRDYSWISRGFVFLYQEGDSEYTEIGDSRPDRVYQKALVEAKEYALKLHAINEQNINPDKERNLKPLPYTKITRNRPIPPVKLFDENDEDGDKVCECTEMDEDPCGPNSVCMNRMLFFECDPAFCKAGDKCQNQRFEKRQYPNMVERRIEGKGWGLVTLETIPAGTFIIEYVGELINQKEFDRRIHEMQQTKDEHYYFLTLTRDLIIDAGPRGNSSRFINHSCEPNCETQCWQVKGNTRVGLFALDDIPANTELTFNYNLECIGELKKTCHCGAKRCAGFIGAKYVDPDERSKTVKKEKTKKKTGGRPPKSLPKIPLTKKNTS